ncbi:MAG: 2-C-methyl-D-erythritol 4-phosphate cytidylyltransferase [Lachnospiraceae bacterium]|nr:2-C-methyl-D-erythritol 4-phosphate cytidylyltransferase [Lachnospiraceae bacterium]
MKYTAVVLAGGAGKRMNSDVPKQYLELNGKPILAHSLIAFQNSDVDDIIVVCKAGDEDYIRREYVEKYNINKVSAICVGGKERYNSVYNGLKACVDSDYVLIHDGARPYVSKDIIKRNMEEVVKYHAVVTAVVATDTIKIADEDGFVVTTPIRKNCYAMQTPQTFEYKLIFEAYDKYINALESGEKIQVTDDAQVMELYMNKRVKLIEGEYTNIKITNPSDMR